MKFYALYAPYGIRAAYGDNHWPIVHTFTSKKERDEWVADDPELKKEACTWAEAKKYLGEAYQPQARYQEKVQLIAKSYKLKKELTEDFAAACAANGETQASVLSRKMREYIEESKRRGST